MLSETNKIRYENTRVREPEEEGEMFKGVEFG